MWGLNFAVFFRKILYKTSVAPIFVGDVAVFASASVAVVGAKQTFWISPYIFVFWRAPGVIVEDYIFSVFFRYFCYILCMPAGAVVKYACCGNTWMGSVLYFVYGFFYICNGMVGAVGQLLKYFCLLRLIKSGRSFGKSPVHANVYPDFSGMFFKRFPDFSVYLDKFFVCVGGHVV